MENAPDTSVLRVAVTTALGAQPLENALVTVSTAPDENGTRTLLYAVRTDRDGMPPRSASLAPGQVTPYALYTVEAMREGFVPLTALHVTLFAGVPAVLPVALTPLPEKE